LADLVKVLRVTVTVESSCGSKRQANSMSADVVAEGPDTETAVPIIDAALKNNSPTHQKIADETEHDIEVDSVDSTDDEDGGGLSTGAIIGIAIACGIVGGCVLLIGVVLFMQHRKDGMEMV